MILSPIKRSFLISFARFSLFAALLLSVTVNLHAQTTYKVGSTGGTHTTIAAAYAACSTSTNYIIEIMPNYGTIEVALGGITLGANTATSITIRPQAGNTSFAISTTIIGAIFEINAASNVTIDGRPGGTGTTGLLTLENKNSAAGVGGMYVVRFSGGATQNTVQYCTIKGSNPNTASTSSGVIGLGDGVNNSNTIDHCTIQASGTSKPPVAINSYTASGQNNNNITISNCNIVDFTAKGIWITNSSNTGWNITGNSFYQTAAFTAATPVEMISIGNGSGYTISGNFLGGQAPGCGGSAYTLTSGTYTPFKGIYFSSSTLGSNNTITNNTIQNISMSGNNYSSVYGFAGIYLRGGGTFMCGGGAGLGNTIGSLSTANSITYSNPSPTGGIAGFAAIVDSAVTSNEISYNSIGGIQINTGLTNAASDIIMVSAGTATVDNNSIGNAAAPITHTNLATLTLINNTTSNFTATNNTIQGISLTNSAGTNTLYGIKNSGVGTYTCSYNTISNISSINNGLVNIFTYSSSSGSGTFQFNTVNTISLTNTGTTGGLNVFNITSSAPATIDNNTIGNTTATNISVATNKICNVIVNGGGGTFTVTNNIIQNIYLSTASTLNGFIGIGVTAGYSVFVCTGNTIQNITSATACTTGYGCIYSNTVATGLVVSGNTIQGIAFTNSTVATINNGIYLGGTSTYGGTANGNMVTGLSNNSTVTTAKLVGIEMANGSWNVQNNVVLLDNAGGSSTMFITGIDVASTGTTNNIYSNTVKISGTQTGALGSVACGGSTTLGTYTVKNNLFQNIRSGGTGAYYAEYYPGLTSIATSYNYVESSTPSTIGKKSSTVYTSATWPTASPSSVTGTTTLDAAGKVISAPFAGAGKGSAPPPVTTDYSGVTRSSTAPWMGAYEGVQITTSAISPATMCAGASISVGFTVSGTITASYNVQLSDATGSFTSPVTLVSNATTNPITVTIPTATVTGTGYRIRVIHSSQTVNTADNGTNLTINAIVIPSVVVNASATTICTGDFITFTPTPTNGGSGPFYQWQKNGTAIPGASSSSYSTNSAANGDKFSAVMTSFAACASPSTTTSAQITITVNTLPTVSVTPDFSVCTTTSNTTLAATISGSATGVTWTTSGNGTFSNANVLNPVYTFTAAERSAGQVTLTATTTGSSCTEASATVTITFTPAPVIPATTTTAICSGGSTNITLSSTPTATSYTWTRAVVTGITQAAGSGTTNPIAETLTNSTAAAITVVYSVKPIMGTCIGNATSISQIVNPTVTPSVTVNASTTTICQGDFVTFSPTPTNGGSGPFYQWQKNGVTIPGASSLSYSTSSITNGDQFSVSMYSNAACASPSTVVSPAVTMTVNPIVTPSVAAGSSTTIICSGASVSFTAAASNGGPGPLYQWLKNGTAVSGATSLSYTTTAIVNGDQFSVSMTSNASCISKTTDTSNVIIITVNPTLIPAVTVTASATTVCPGTSIIFTPTPTNGGTSPSYQWQKNGTNIAGASTSSYSTTTAANGDKFSVVMTSNATCASPLTATSPQVTIIVNPTVTPSVIINASATTICSGTFVTFLPTPTNGGSGPFYQWKKNGTTIAGASTSSYSTSSIANGDQFSVSMMSNAACASPSTVVSPAITMTVNPIVTPSVVISATATTICSGINVTFTATPTNGGTTPAYQWSKNGTNIASATNSTYATTAAANNDVFSVVLTSSDPCASTTTASSTGITMTVNPVLTPSVVINASATTICAGANVSFTSTPTNGGTTPTYQWRKNGTNIAGASTASYSTTAAANADIFTVVLTSNATCASPATAISAGVVMTVNPVLTPSVVVNTSATTICTGTNVTFTPTPTNGGTTPSYQWQKNGTNIAGASTSSYSTTTAANGDIFTVVLTSNATCAAPTTVTSAGVTITVNSTLVPAVTIAATATTICAGTSVTFTATPTNGGTTPAYQWRKNGTNIAGASTASYVTTAAANGDIFTVVLTSNAGCASPTTATSTGITMTVNPVLVPSVVINTSATTICTGTSIIFTPTPTNGGASPSYQWQKNGTTIAGASTASYSTTTAANGDKFSVVMTSNATCASPLTATSSQVNITVNPTLVPDVTINASATTICIGTNVTFTSTPTNGGTSPSYQWQKNGTNVAGASTSSYSTTAATNGDIFTVVLTSNATCATPTTATSAGVTMTVNSTLVPAVSIAATATTICTGTSVTFTATPINGGTTPAYQWRKNGTNIAGASASSYVTTAAANGDIFTVVLTSNAGCASPTTATSTGITMTVNPILTPSVIVNASATAICSGSNVTFTATPTNGGSGPLYQWKKNGTAIAGASASSYSTTTAISTDQYSVTITSNATCASATPVTSAPVSVTANTSPVATAGSDISACATGGAISLSGSISSASSSQWTSSGTGSFSNAASLSSTYTPSAADISDGQTKIILHAINAPCVADTDTLIITYTAAPTISAGTDKSYCANVESFTLNGSGASGTWSGGSGTYTPNASTSNAIYTPTTAEITAGSVTLTYTSVAGLCPVVSDQVKFTFKPLPTVNSVAAVSICSGTSTNIALTSTPVGASFNWTVNAVSGTVTGASASSGTSISQNLTVASGSGTVNYIVTPTLSTCAGTPLTIPVTVSIPVISPASLNPATFGAAYIPQTFTTTNMTTPIWTSTASIPGMTVSSAGVLSGTPTASNTYNFTVTATQGLCTATQNYSLVVSLSTTTWDGTSWSNGSPTATTAAVINGNYTTGKTETFTANTITVNNGSTFTIAGTSAVTAGSFTNNGIVNQQCTSSLVISSAATGNAVVIIQPVLTPATLNNGTITSAYNQTTPFTVSFGNSPIFTAAGLPAGLNLVTDNGVTQIKGIPTVAGTYTMAVTVTDGAACMVSTPVTLKILNLTNPKLKFPQPTLVKTFDTDTSFVIAATSQSAAPITYSISPASNGCVNLVNGAVKISCVPSTDIWLVASQAYTAQYQAAKDSVKIIVNKATPVVSLLTLPGMLINKSVLFDYQLPPDYTGTASYDQVDGQQIATVDASGNMTGLSKGNFSIDVQLTGTDNFFSLDTTFTFTVYDQYQKPTAVPDTVILVRSDGTLEDGSINLLKNDYGTTGHLRINLTDIDIINPGNQSIFYNPTVGTFDLDEQTGILTVHPTKGLTGTARIGYTVTDSNGVTSDVAYVTIEIRNTQDLPDLKANEVMTPNNDTKNDVLYIGYTDASKSNEIIITDAASNIIYKTSNYQNDWAGVNSKGELVEAGVYFFFFTEDEGLGRQLKGYIEIVR